MKSKKIDSNTPEPRKVSLLKNIVFGIEAGAMDDPPTPTTPKAKPRKRTAPKVRTKRNDPDTDERKTAMQVNYERVRFEQEKKCRHIRARIDELKRVAKVDIWKANNERDSLYHQLAGQLTEKYNAKVRSLKNEGVAVGSLRATAFVPTAKIRQSNILRLVRGGAVTTHYSL